MCSNKTPLSMNKKRRKSRPKKPKFLSLRRQFPPNDAASADSRQLDLFPLHPENDREIQDQADNVALFFSAADTSLTGLLDNSSHTDNNSSRVECPWAQSEELVRAALRSRDRDSGEEKWVRYSEVVERKVKEEEVSSSTSLLKLDYQEIINAWSNKRPLFVDAEASSQIVPDIFHEVSGWGNNSGLWRVPEIENGEEMKNITSIGQRKASVLRYKEKRQNRLFSKKIRYQVRKLNAEKRPRLKGRFVKKS